ncbi:hypothetical protein VCJ71_02965 [Alteriqipengyuania sp. WL0013]|uniref:hypothetical protein n=1 Tax=Alteriqipengyuania sp. WL0013 TaxID=3110773 RepID=UPI002B89BA44|nr:hypothetical protein [Alteriqipengyuania sp. WL0013]MEB3415022.1 hypothetical protein [Alteriqipengyuania sp. WL0013]
MADTSATTPKTRTTKAPKVETVEATSVDTMAETSPNKAEAKARFSKAIDEAKAGAAALRDEAKVRAAGYREQGKSKSGDLSAEAKTKARGLAQDGKTAASDALSGLGRLVSENASVVDEKLGAKYGDYARSASRSLQETSAKLEQKELDELAEDAREFVRKSPGLAVGLAAFGGYMISRLFRR